MEHIRNGAWNPGDMIPSEYDLQQHFDLSRTTIRQALRELVSDGYLYRERGKGTFVAKPKVTRRIQEPYFISGPLHADGLKLNWKLLSMKTTAPSGKVIDALEVAEEDEVLEVKRLLYVDDKATILQTVWVPFPLAANITRDDMTPAESSLDYLKQHHDITLREVQRTIQAVPANEVESTLLTVEEGTPVLLIRRRAISTDGRCVEFVKAICRTGQFEYSIYFENP